MPRRHPAHRLLGLPAANPRAGALRHRLRPGAGRRRAFRRGAAPAGSTAGGAGARALCQALAARGIRGRAGHAGLRAVAARHGARGQAGGAVPRPDRAAGAAADRRTALWFVAGAAGALVAFRLLAMGLIALSRRLHPRRPALRLALANLHRPGAPTAGVVASLGLGLAVLVAIVLVHADIAATVDETLPARAPSFFFIDIQPDQLADFDRLLAGMPGVEEIARVPSLRGRITALNGTPVEQAKVAPEAQWAVRSERGLTYAAELPPGSRLVAGAWWPRDYRGAPLLSLDANLARGMNLKVGDTLTVNVLGREVTAAIANLREIDWSSLGINFALVLSPGTPGRSARSPPISC